MGRRNRSVGSLYVRNSIAKAHDQGAANDAVLLNREDLIDAIASDLGEELDRCGVSVKAFDDDACDRFARDIIVRYRIHGRVKG